MLDRALEWISRTLLVLAALLAFVLCFIVVADVIGRVLFNRPLKGTPEIVSYSIVVICYLQAAYAIRSGGMISTDAFTAYLPLRVQSLLAAFGALLGVLLFAHHLLGRHRRRRARLDLGRVRGRGRAAHPGLAGALRHRRRHGAGGAQLRPADAARNLDAFRRGAPPAASSTSH